MKRILISQHSRPPGAQRLQARTAGETPSALPTEDATPTNTAEPMALVVNGEGISMNEYNAALKRLQEAQQSINKVTTPQEQKDRVRRKLRHRDADGASRRAERQGAGGCRTAEPHQRAHHRYRRRG